MMNLETTRREYRNGKITFKELDRVFSLKATKKELDGFYRTPVYDRPNFVIGKTQAEMDREWIETIK